MTNSRQSQWILIFFAAILAATLACSTLAGNEPADTSAAGTEIAAEIFATQTAEVPDVTDTSAPSS